LLVPNIPGIFDVVQCFKYSQTCFNIWFHFQKKINLKVSDAKSELVGVHVRRTDYINHMGVVHPGSEVAEPKFYTLAMDWMRNMTQAQLIFIVVSDDKVWTEENIVKNVKDAYFAGDLLFYIFVSYILIFYLF
jgi:hypothetical protein